MTIRSYRSMLVPLALVAALALASSTAYAVAAPDKVYVTSVNNKIYEVDWPSLTLKTVVNSPGTSFKGLAVTTRNANTFIVVANHNQGGNIKFCNTSGQCKNIASLPFPSGLTVDPNGNIYVTNEHAGRVDQVWMLRRNMVACPDSIANPVNPSPASSCPNAGYDTAVVNVDSEVRIPPSGPATTILADVTFANGSLYVLVQQPAYLLKYVGDLSTCNGNCVPVDGNGDPGPFISTAAFGGKTATSVAITSEIYVGTAQGSILRFNLGNGSPISPAFVANAGGSISRIAAGLLEGTPGLVATILPKNVRRYGIQANGTAQTMPKTVGGLNAPVGVNWGGTATSAAVSGTGTGGSGFASVAFTSITAEFEDVSVPGFGTVECITFDDPREVTGNASSCPATNESDPLGCALDLDNSTDIPLALQARNLALSIPSYVRGFGRGTPSGTKILRLCFASTTAQFQGIVDLHADERTWLGYDPHCGTVADPGPGSPDPTWLRPRFFWGEDEPPPLSEGDTFINATIFCNRDEGEASNFGSVFLPSVRDTRVLDNTSLSVAASAACTATEGLVDCQLNHLDQVFGANMACIAQPLRSTLDSALTAAISAFDLGGYRRAKANLVFFEQAIRCDTGSSFTGCPATFAAELRARSAAAAFELGQPELCGPVVAPPPACPAPSFPLASPPACTP